MYSDSESAFLLPKLKSERDVRTTEEAGTWDLQEDRRAVFSEIASSLDYKSPRQVKSVGSIPNIWARPLLMEMALYNKAHPLHQQMVEQWRGMLAAIALAEMRGFPLTAQRLELEELRHQGPFARSLYELLPDPSVNALYTLEGRNPWEDIYVFLWESKPVGMSSPSTIVVPSEAGRWEELPWWNGENCCLKSPQGYLNSIEKNILWLWLENLSQELNDHQGQTKALDMMRGLLKDFRNSLGNYPEQRLSLSNNPQFFGVPLNRGVLNALNRTVEIEPPPSCVRLIGSESKKGIAPELYVIDPEIARAWEQPPQNIWVYENKTLAYFNIKEYLHRREVFLQRRDILIEAKDIFFLPTLTFIDIEDALQGALLPEGTESLIFNHKRVTPLLPISPILLNYFTPEDLIKIVTFKLLEEGDEVQVEVSLDLPLSGMDSENKPQNFHVSKKYRLQEENIIPELPVLEVWPNFRLEGWQIYYGFYCDGGVGEGTFQVSFPNVVEESSFREDDANFKIVKLDTFPDYITCENSKGQLVGIIILRHEPLKASNPWEWRISLDFGTHFTNIYVDNGNARTPFKFENLLWQITKSHPETRLNLLYEYFIPESFLPVDKPLPLQSILSIRGARKDRERWQPLIDGRVYCPNYNNYNPELTWIKTNFNFQKDNWGEMRQYIDLFLAALILHITAQATKSGVATIQWSLSYGSHFSIRERNYYHYCFCDLAKEIKQYSGIKQIYPEPDDPGYYQSKTLTFARYFADGEGYPLTHAVCLQIEDGISNISVWEENELVAECSLSLAEREIFSQFLHMNAYFRDKNFAFSQSDKYLSKEAFDSKLDRWLLLEGDTWLKQKRALCQQDQGFQKFIQLTAIGIAGLYYYIGLLLKILYEEGKYTRNTIPAVYIGGKDSRLLHWLDQLGKFDRYSEVNALLSRMLAVASGFEDTEIVTRLSQRPQDEVACGLLLNETKLKGKDWGKEKEIKPVVSGEDCTLNGQKIAWNHRLILEENDERVIAIQDFQIPQLTQVPKFFYDFNTALQELNIEVIKPLNTYSRSSDPGDNIKLWRETQEELTALLEQVKDNSKEAKDNPQANYLEPPFILGLKALLRVLGREWTDYTATQQ